MTGGLSNVVVNGKFDKKTIWKSCQGENLMRPDSREKRVKKQGVICYKR